MSEYRAALARADKAEYANADLARERDEARAELAAANASVVRLREALTNIGAAKDAPNLDGDYLTGLRCGVEDRDITDRYDAAEYGFERASERFTEWATNEANAALASTPVATLAEHDAALFDAHAMFLREMYPQTLENAIRATENRAAALRAALGGG